MDFMKLFALCRTRKLYFPSIAELRKQDPFEGSYTLYHSTYQLCGTFGDGQTKTWIARRDGPPSVLDEREWRYAQDVDAINRQNLGRFMFVNSWHMSEGESLAMWKLYDPSGQGIAVVSTFERLRKSLESAPETVHIGCVAYVDYQTEEKWLGNLLDPVIHKHRAFSHESEIRAVIWDTKSYGAYLYRIQREVASRHGFELEPVTFYRDGESVAQPHYRNVGMEPPSGLALDCDLGHLVEYVVVSPTSPQWVMENIEYYLSQAIGKKVVASELKSGPFF